MPVGPLQNFRRHSEKPSRLPDRNTSLHEPGCGRVAKRVRRYPAPQARELCSSVERRLDRLDRRSVPFHEMRSNDAPANPTPHVPQQTGRDRGRSLSLLACSPTDGLPIKNSLFDVHERVSEVAIGRRRRDGPGPSAGIKPDQDESSQVAKRPLLCLNLVSLMTTAMHRLLSRDNANKPRADERLPRA